MIAYSSLLNFAKNDNDDAELQRLLARATAVCPSCLAPRRQYLVALTPRWGGSYEKMEAYLSSLVPEIEKHPRLAVLRGFVAMDRALDARRRDDHEEAVRLLDQAMRHGDYWAYRSERAKELYRLGRYPEALADCEYWLAHGTIRGEALLWKARSLEKLGRSAEAAAATDLARKLDPTRS